MSLQVLDAAAMDAVAGGILPLIGTTVVATVVSMATTAAVTGAIRSFERLQPGGADDTTWANTGLVGMGA
jgi:hypothetical protein